MIGPPDRFAFASFALGLLLATAAVLLIFAKQSGQELTGSWQVTELVYEGQTVPKEKLDQGQATITAERITVRLPQVDEGLLELTYKLVPEGIDLLAPSDQPEYDPLLGVFELKRDTLRI